MSILFLRLIMESAENSGKIYTSPSLISPRLLTVNRELLFKILEKLGCPAKFVCVTKDCILECMQDCVLMENFLNQLNIRCQARLQAHSHSVRNICCSHDMQECMPFLQYQGSLQI